MLQRGAGLGGWVVRAAFVVTLGSLLAPRAANAEGDVIYRQVCAACHATGVAGAPKLGDKADWARRLVAGRASMLSAVLRGKGQMPPKGGNASLSDRDVEAAMEFMLSKAQ